jgi:hypothetical protein
MFNFNLIFTYIISVPYYATDNGPYEETFASIVASKDALSLFFFLLLWAFYLICLLLMRTLHANHAADDFCYI